jgi:hypothetical protein
MKKTRLQMHVHRGVSSKPAKISGEYISDQQKNEAIDDEMASHCLSNCGTKLNSNIRVFLAWVNQPLGC